MRNFNECGHPANMKRLKSERFLTETIKVSIFGDAVVVRMSQATLLSYRYTYRHAYIDTLPFSITLLQ